MTGVYGRDSRYYRIPEVTRVDHCGRIMSVDELRQRPPTAGSYRHTIEANDRLDHLAQRYYAKPRRWWQIVDANPEFSSPLALLGDEPIAVVEVGVLLPEGIRWFAILGALRALAGVEDVALGADAVDGQGVLTIRFNCATVGVDALRKTIAEAADMDATNDIVTSAPRMVTRIGRQIVIPPDGVG